MSKKAGKMTVDLSGFNAKMKALSSAAQGEALRSAVEAGARVIQANAQINANEVFSDKATNTLANSIIVETESNGKNKASANIGPTVVYGRIQELGGIVKPVVAKMLSWVDDGKRIFAKYVQLRPRPYLRPAVDGKEDQIKQAIENQLKESIKAALKK